MVKLLTLKREFEMLRMKDGETVKEYSSKILDTVNKIRLLGEDFSDLKVVEKMLISLPARFEAKISTIEESCDLKSLTVAELISKLQTQEHRSSMREEDTLEGAFPVLQVKNKGTTAKKERKKYGSDKSGKNKAAGNSKEARKQGKFPPYKYYLRNNHLEKDCWYKGKDPIQCNFCKRMGHIDKACRLKQKQANEQPQQHVNVADEQEDATDKLFMVSNCNINWSDQMWFVDSGCTSHMS
ncbi:UNVERIFIED_CONTAM: hypothetical protein Sradi_5671000 [Sesamum radiatum]|uniref:Retrovirus-related Pol polyprotein from transposon TNT 1-94 n=1 Tax=Sesamum radiatum TaxID=300843 RepID=A0AAW2L1M2_SESRA